MRWRGRVATAAAAAVVLVWGAVRAGAQEQAEGAQQAAGHEIADGQGALVQKMVPMGEALPEGWMLDSVTVERKRIEVGYRAQEGGDALVFTLVHPSAPAQDAEGSERETERFKLLVPEGPEEAPTAELADALEKSVRAHEGEFEWKQIEPPPEPDAVEQGSAEQGDDAAEEPGSEGGGCSCAVLR